MKLLLHTCCAPCLVYPYSFLRDKGIDVTVFFYNPNIHPFLEFKKRLDTLKQYATNLSLSLIVENQYGLTDFLHKTVFHETQRCGICYSMRLEKTAEVSRDLGFDGFSTTLLYSKYQQHDFIASLSNKIAINLSTAFIYYDYRVGWQSGVDKSREMKLYRQPYCGCIYSEQERYDKSLKK